MTGWLAVAVFALGCAATSPSTRSPADEARLAALPHVPFNPEFLHFPPELQGLTFRVNALIDEPGAPNEARREACAVSFAQWMSAAGWIAIRDPNAPVDLTIEEHCNGQLWTGLYGNLLEMRHPVAETVAIVVEHDGAQVLTVPRGQPDYVCESNGTPGQISTDCEARAERWAQAQIVSALIASAPLAELARRGHDLRREQQQ